MESLEIDGKIRVVQLWSDGDTKKLLDKYAAYLPEIGPMKKFKNKKEMWAQVSKDVGMDKTPKQCEERLRTVLKRKKTAVQNNNTSGAKRQHVEYEDELAVLCSLDDSISPEIRISSQNSEFRQNTSAGSTPKSSNTSAKKKMQPFEFNIKKEEAKERRHNERMELARQNNKLMEKILEKLLN